MSGQPDELQKEFELERMILFSDAVFAIAITLLILEVRFPHLPANPAPGELITLFQPVLIRFSAFVISFFFIGVMWAKHLALFKYLRSYNNTVIGLNLLFIFFIVCFPFTVSGFSENTHSRLVLPLFLYMGNITGVSIAKAILSGYVFRKNSPQAVPGFTKEKRYIVLESVWTAAAFVVTLPVMYAICLFYPDRPDYVIRGVWLLIILMVLIRRLLKKYKPVEVGNPGKAR